LLGELAAEGDEGAKKALRDAMKSKDAKVREWAVEALNDSGLVEFIPDLKALMKDGEPDVREEVTQTLAGMPADKAGPLLVSMLNDPNQDVVLGALEGIGGLEYKAAINDLIPLTRSGDERIAINAAIAMNDCGDSSAAENWVPTLGSRLNSTDVDTRRRAIRDLRHMGLESSRPYLEQAAKDEDGRVRHDAERALRHLGNK
jgi:HEAT repeat protein